MLVDKFYSLIGLFQIILSTVSVFFVLKNLKPSNKYECLMVY